MTREEIYNAALNNCLSREKEEKYNCEVCPYYGYHQCQHIIREDINKKVNPDAFVAAGLIEEGYIRELVSKIQNMRKEAGFEVQDYIDVYYTAEGKILDVIERNEKEIASEVLGKSISEGSGEGFSKELDINGLKVNVTVNNK